MKQEPIEPENKDEIRVSVRSLVEFLLRSGDIDNRRRVSSESAMQEGSRIHRMIQGRMGPEYEAEVTLRHCVSGEHYDLWIEGRADGIIRTKDGVTIDEIKGTYRSLDRMKEPVPEHLAQAKCYAYITGLAENLEEVKVRLTYCNIETEEIRYFYADFFFSELAAWFDALVEKYRRWADLQWEWRRTRQASIQGLPFPYPYRPGQKELAIQVYQTLRERKKLYLEAPTGVGKTLSTVYPAVQALGRDLGDRIFYLTAKTITRTVAEETFELLREKGLRLKSIVLTAKDKICPLEKTDCNPEACPRAKGHFDRINEALYRLVTGEERISREAIERCAETYMVCPFELMLDATLFSDAIIGDYNYLFDPHVRLKRFFAEGVRGDYFFLIDEAHNLVERGREMYSAILYKEAVSELSRSLKRQVLEEAARVRSKDVIPGQMTLGELEGGLLTDGAAEETPLAALELPTAEEVEALSTERVDTLYRSLTGKGKKHRGGSVLVHEGYAEKMVYHLDRIGREMLMLKRETEGQRVLESIDDLLNLLARFYAVVGDYLGEHEEHALPIREEILDLYFEVSHFLEMAEEMDEGYIPYAQIEDDGRFYVKLFCVHPGQQLRRCMAMGQSSILFSATFLPIRYYKNLLGGEESDYEAYAHSVFDPERRGLFIAEDVTSKYTRRSREEYRSIAGLIAQIVRPKPGNYMIFFPSHSFLEAVYDCYMEEFCSEEQECICQGESMSEEEREAFLARFSAGEDAGALGAAREVLWEGLPDMELEEEAEATEDGEQAPWERLLGMPVETEEGSHSVLGFCVLGGIFGEGIDLKEDRLIGAIVVGTGIPLVCFERELLKDYFNENGGSGFDYAYRFPGMNKVLQAAGRVIRTERDLGVVALLDGRFLQSAYRKLYPVGWENYRVIRAENAGSSVQNFWEKWN